MNSINVLMTIHVFGGDVKKQMLFCLIEQVEARQKKSKYIKCLKQLILLTNSLKNWSTASHLVTLEPVFRDFFPDLSVCVQPRLEMTKHGQCCNTFVK